MSDAGEIFIRAKISKLTRRLDHQRRTGLELDPYSIFAFMNRKAVSDMEMKLTKLKSIKPTARPRGIT